MKIGNCGFQQLAPREIHVAQSHEPIPHTAGLSEPHSTLSKTPVASADTASARCIAFVSQTGVNDALQPIPGTDLPHRRHATSRAPFLQNAHDRKWHSFPVRIAKRTMSGYSVTFSVS